MGLVRKPLLAFNIQPSTKSKAFVRVKVFKYMKDMYAYAHSKFCVCPDDYDALYMHPRKGGLDCGEILLVLGRSGPSRVSHECTHAAYTFLHRTGVEMPDRYAGPFKGRYMDNPEEHLAYAIGNMTSQIYNRLITYDEKAA